MLEPNGNSPSSHSRSCLYNLDINMMINYIGHSRKHGVLQQDIGQKVQKPLATINSYISIN